MNRLYTSVFLFVLALLLVPGTALAYGGPGSVISGIGALLAAVGALLAALFGFVWYPLKRIYQSVSGEDREDEPAETVSE